MRKVQERCNTPNLKKQETQLHNHSSKSIITTTNRIARVFQVNMTSFFFRSLKGSFEWDMWNKRFLSNILLSQEWSCVIYLNKISQKAHRSTNVPIFKIWISHGKCLFPISVWRKITVICFGPINIIWLIMFNTLWLEQYKKSQAFLIWWRPICLICMISEGPYMSRVFINI